MKTNFYLSRFYKVVLVLMTVILIAGMMSCRLIGFPADILREDITFEEAQELVSFPICIPTYISPGIDPAPKIIYDTDDPNIPEVTYIRLRYKRLDEQEKVLEAYQRYTPDAGMKTAYPESDHGGAIVTLLWWISDPKRLSESETDKAVERTQLEANVFQTDQTVWWLYEVVDPSEYRSTMTEWVKDHVEYRIPSYLPAEEIKKVTLSMFECSNP